jgi:hypothetical protein
MRARGCWWGDQVEEGDFADAGVAEVGEGDFAHFGTGGEAGLVAGRGRWGCR